MERKPGSEIPEQVVLTVYAQPVKVELERSPKGTYRWSIAIHSETPHSVVRDLDCVDQALRDQYLEKTPEVQE